MAAGRFPGVACYLRLEPAADRAAPPPFAKGVTRFLCYLLFCLEWSRARAFLLNGFV
jgi:hypothetical protein